MSKTVLLFPGQGSQAVGMGKPLADAYAVARETFEEADDALGYSISKMCFEGPEEDLTLTANTQPAILTCSVAALRALRSETDVGMDLAMGHSLGEFSALVAVGALAFGDAVRLVNLRGKAMQDAVAPGVGAMAAIIGLDAEALEEVCEAAAQGEVVSPANENGGGQIVIAGHAAAVERACDLAEEKEARAIPLKVSAPFHCSLMQPAADRLEEALQGIEVGAMAAPVITNVDAEPNDDPQRVKASLVRQVTHRVRWEASVRKALHVGASAAFEVGHGRVLAGLFRRISRELKVRSVGSPDNIDVLKTGR
jgi:[acyl-carrier-protein] S-malonyltransferase